MGVRVIARKVARHRQQIVSVTGGGAGAAVHGEADQVLDRRAFGARERTAVVAGEEAAGQYFIAYSCVMIATYVPAAIFQRYLLPRLHHWAEHDLDKLRLVYRLGLRSMLALGILAAAVTAAAGLFLIEPLFGLAYAPAGRALALLALILPVRFPVACLSALLVTRGNIGLKLRLDLLALRDVAGECSDVTTTRGQRCGCLVKSVAPPGCDDDPRAVADELPGQREANAGGRPCDDDHPTVEILHSHLLGA